MNILDILKEVKIEEEKLFLPDIKLEGNTYLEVADKLKLIGGKWNKKGYFLFEENPQYLIDMLLEGKQINLKKEYQFFPTPKEVADTVASLAYFDGTSKILEPSAGKGSLIRAIHDYIPDKKIDCYELMDLNVVYLKRNFPSVNILGQDFLQHDTNIQYDCIIANPPFSKNQDVLHVTKMIETCKKGGNIVSVMSNHWRHCDNKKEVAFRELIEQYDHEIIEVSQGSFKESGTNIACCILVINKN